MTHPDPHAHAGHGAATPAAGQPHFPAAEWNAFQADDKKAGTVIIGLMAGIFTTGLVIYLVIAWIVA